MNTTLYKEIPHRLKWYIDRIKQLGGYATELTIEQPATEEEVIAAEKRIGTKIPEPLRNLFLSFSSHIVGHWTIYESEATEKVLLSEEIEEIYYGSIAIALNSMYYMEESRKDWIKNCYPNEEDPYDKVYHNKFAFCDVENGDLIAIDLDENTYGNIVYLSHDGADMHGYVLANSLEEFLDNWTKLGCVGPEHWLLELFTNKQTTPIDAQCENAKLWYNAIGREDE